MNSRIVPPKLNEPSSAPVFSLSAKLFNSAESYLGRESVVGESSEDGALIISWANITTEPDEIPTILSLPVSIPKKAQIFVMKDVGPLLL